MRTKEPFPCESVKGRRPLATAKIVLGAAFGVAALAFAAWFMLVGVEQNHGEPLRNQPDPVAARGTLAAYPPADPLMDFVSSILGDTEDVWREKFRLMKQAYKEPRLVLFKGQARSECGTATSAAGPSYCPLDEKIYIDLGVFQEFKDRYHTEADFARAYVIAHEVGHHVQKLLKISEKALALQQGLDKDQKEQLSVRLELQADFFAGVWAHDAHKARQILEPGDVEAGAWVFSGNR